MARILQAVGEVIAEKGANRIGINAVAEKAGVNKVLIYRYFGGWEGLMQHFLQQGNFLTEYNRLFLEKHGQLDGTSNSQNRIQYLVGILRELKNRDSALEMLKWELTNPGAYVSQQLAIARNESYQKVIETFFSSEKEDLSTVTALLLSGLAMLFLIAPNQNHFMDLDLKSDESWNRIEQVIQRIYTDLQ